MSKFLEQIADLERAVVYGGDVAAAREPFSRLDRSAMAEPIAHFLLGDLHTSRAGVCTSAAFILHESAYCTLQLLRLDAADANVLVCGRSRLLRFLAPEPLMLELFDYDVELRKLGAGRRCTVTWDDVVELAPMRRGARPEIRDHPGYALQLSGPRTSDFDLAFDPASGRLAEIIARDDRSSEVISLLEILQCFSYSEGRQADAITEALAAVLSSGPPLARLRTLNMLQYTVPADQVEAVLEQMERRAVTI